MSANAALLRIEEVLRNQERLLVQILDELKLANRKH
ncbi:hypothetical protein LCGC14_2113840 [marine sediment metagenome]|uniref:Uncharacterized protein n=1 Tax=marine sediment metagenome TaxID=412755 RepID=A0A0F9E6D7_9ZZZZ